MTNVYLISEQLIRNQSLIDNNVDSMFLNAAIRYAQDVDLQEVIGSGLYYSILGQVETGVWKSNYYHTLLDEYIQPYLCQQVMSEIIIPLQAKIKNQGVVLSNDSHFQTLSMNDAIRVKEDYEHKAAFLANRMKDYILDNKAEFDEVSEKQHIQWTRHLSTNCPIYFPK